MKRCLAHVFGLLQDRRSIGASPRAPGNCLQRFEQPLINRGVGTGIDRNRRECRVEQIAERLWLSNEPRIPVLVRTDGRRQLPAGKPDESLPKPVDARDRGERLVDARRERVQRHFDQLLNREGRVLVWTAVGADHVRPSEFRGELEIPRWQWIHGREPRTFGNEVARTGAQPDADLVLVRERECEIEIDGLNVPARLASDLRRLRGQRRRSHRRFRLFANIVGVQAIDA